MVKKRDFVVRALILSLAIFIVQAFIVLQSRVYADQFSWTGDVNPAVVLSNPATIPGDCPLTQSINVAGLGPKDVCVSEGGSLRLGTYLESGGVFPTTVSFGYDSKMYKVNGIATEYNEWQYIPSKDMLVTKHNLSTGSPGLVIYDNFSSRLTKSTNEYNFATEYNFNTSNPAYIFKSQEGYQWPVNGISASENGEWLVFWARDRAVMLLNTNSFEAKRLSIQRINYGISTNTKLELDITNDATRVAIMGNAANPLVFDVSDSCGDIASDEQLQDNIPISQPCPSKDLSTFSDNYIEQFKEAYKPKFDIAGGELTFYATSYSAPSKLVTLRAPGYTSPPQLDYLALGDSYSSGEGDTETNSEGNKYYLAFTDNNGDYTQAIPREKCHQSSRAWPFILADSLGNSQEKNETVACSGATIGDIASSKDNYQGQYNGGNPNIPRLQGLPNAEALKNTSLQEFIPGRDRQVKFVERYKPKTITVGISGNDVKFGDIIRYCSIGTPFSTCSSADTVQGTTGLGEQIVAQYSHLVTLYTRLHNASAETKIYAVGYPKFVSTGNSCDVNVQLSEEERKMAEEAVTYLNDVIEAAAKRAGVKYIDIEDSLNGKRLCDTYKPYVTGLAAWIKSENQESFHPNYQGNKLIADAVKSVLEPDNILSYRNCETSYVLDFCPNPSINPPEPTPFFANAIDNNQSTKNEQLTSGIVNKTELQTLKTDPFSLQPGSIVNIELRSDPINLGEYIVKQDGSLLGNITIPNSVPAGYHTLYIYGNSYSGEPISLMQIIEVRGAEGDIDEDGIPDISDPCLYIAIANRDSDFDGIDDACDPEISNNKPYRVRNGDVNKGEIAEYIYIERNIKASAFTGVVGDYDPDNDGWAIVAASDNKNQSGVLANFWIDESKIPHVSVNTIKNGCVLFKPHSLTLVMPSEKRKLQQEIKNTDTCLISN